MSLPDPFDLRPFECKEDSSVPHQRFVKFPGVSTADHVFRHDFRIAEQPQKPHLRDAAEGGRVSADGFEPLACTRVMHMPIQRKGEPDIDVR